MYPETPETRRLARLAWGVSPETDPTKQREKLDLLISTIHQDRSVPGLLNAGLALATVSGNHRGIRVLLKSGATVTGPAFGLPAHAPVILALHMRRPDLLRVLLPRDHPLRPEETDTALHPHLLRHLPAASLSGAVLAALANLATTRVLDTEARHDAAMKLFAQTIRDTSLLHKTAPSLGGLLVLLSPPSGQTTRPRISLLVIQRDAEAGHVVNRLSWKAYSKRVFPLITHVNPVFSGNPTPWRAQIVATIKGLCELQIHLQVCDPKGKEEPPEPVLAEGEKGVIAIESPKPQTSGQLVRRLEQPVRCIRVWMTAGSEGRILADARLEAPKPGDKAHITGILPDPEHPVLRFQATLHHEHDHGAMFALWAALDASRIDDAVVAWLLPLAVLEGSHDPGKTGETGETGEPGETGKIAVIGEESKEDPWWERVDTRLLPTGQPRGRPSSGEVWVRTPDNQWQVKPEFKPETLSETAILTAARDIIAFIDPAVAEQLLVLKAQPDLRVDVPYIVKFPVTTERSTTELNVYLDLSATSLYLSHLVSVICGRQDGPVLILKTAPKGTPLFKSVRSTLTSRQQYNALIADIKSAVLELWNAGWINEDWAPRNTGVWKRPNTPELYAYFFFDFDTVRRHTELEVVATFEETALDQYAEQTTEVPGLKVVLNKGRASLFPSEFPFSFHHPVQPSGGKRKKGRRAPPVNLVETAFPQFSADSERLQLGTLTITPGPGPFHNAWFFSGSLQDPMWPVKQYGATLDNGDIIMDKSIITVGDPPVPIWGLFAGRVFAKGEFITIYHEKTVVRDRVFSREVRDFPTAQRSHLLRASASIVIDGITSDNVAAWKIAHDGTLPPWGGGSLANDPVDLPAMISKFRTTAPIFSRIELSDTPTNAQYVKLVFKEVADPFDPRTADSPDVYRIGIYASSKISKGDEIFVAYGIPYWKRVVGDAVEAV